MKNGIKALIVTVPPNTNQNPRAAQELTTAVRSLANELEHFEQFHRAPTTLNRFAAGIPRDPVEAAASPAVTEVGEYVADLKTDITTDSNVLKSERRTLDAMVAQIEKAIAEVKAYSKDEESVTDALFISIHAPAKALEPLSTELTTALNTALAAAFPKALEAAGAKVEPCEDGTFLVTFAGADEPIKVKIPAIPIGDSEESGAEFCGLPIPPRLLEGLFGGGSGF